MLRSYYFNYSESTAVPIPTKDIFYLKEFLLGKGTFSKFIGSTLLPLLTGYVKQEGHVWPIEINELDLTII